MKLRLGVIALLVAYVILGTVTPALRATATPTPTATATLLPGSISQVGSTTSTSTALTVPAGVRDGDLLLAFFSYWSMFGSTAPAGWQLLHTVTSNGSGTEAVWYRFASNDAPGTTYTWSFSGSTPYEAGGMLAFRGVDPAAFEDGFCTTQGNDKAPTFCPFTTNSSDDLYVGFLATENTNLQLPAELLQLVNIPYLRTLNFGATAVAMALPAAGDVPAEVGSMNVGGWASIALALKPLNPGATPTLTPTPTLTETSTAHITDTPTSTATAVPIGITPEGLTSSLTNTLTVPTAVKDGDLLLAFYSYWSLGIAHPPSGWTLLHTSALSNSAVISVWYRFASNDPPGKQYSWFFTGSGPYEAGGMLGLRGVAPSPFEDGFCLNQGRDASPTLCSFGTTTAGDVYFGLFGTENTALTIPADLQTLALTQYLANSNFGVALAAKPLLSSGTVPPEIASMNAGGWVSIAFALRAANAVPTPTSTSTPTAVPPSPSATLTATVTSTTTPSPSPVPPTVTPSFTPTPADQTPVPTATSSITATPTPSIAPTLTATATASTTPSPTPLPITPAGLTSSLTNTLTVPATVQDGDLMLAFYSYWALASAHPPAGWTLLHTAVSSSSSALSVWYRFASNDSPGKQYDWRFTGSGPFEAGGIFALRGVASTSFEDGFCTSQGNSTTPTLCPFITSFSSDVYMGFFATENTNLMTPADLQQLLVTQYLAKSNFGLAVLAKPLVFHGTVPAEMATMNPGGWAGIAFAVRPSSGGLVR